MLLSASNDILTLSDDARLIRNIRSDVADGDGDSGWCSNCISSPSQEL